MRFGATADQSATEIKTAYESNAGVESFTSTLNTKLDGIEASANNYSNTYADGMNQQVATNSSPTFSGLVLSSMDCGGIT